MEATEDESALQTLNLMNDHFVMSPVIEQSLFEQIFYVDDLARRWRPYAATPLVLIDPKVAFGKPIIDGYWVPTDVLSRAYHVEGGLGEAAEEYEVSEEAVSQALDFERHLDEQGLQ